MTNLQSIKFKVKYSISFQNDYYYISGFSHAYSIKVEEKDIDAVLDGIVEMNELEWKDFISDYAKEHEFK